MVSFFMATSWGAFSADLQGLVGTIKRHYEAPNYTAFEVLFPDGQW